MSLFVHVPRTAVAGARAAQPKTGAPFRAVGPRWTSFVLGIGRLASRILHLLRPVFSSFCAKVPIG